MNIGKHLLAVIILLVMGLSFVGVGQAAQTQAVISPVTTALPDLLQFQSAGHVLGFSANEMYVSNGTYAQRVEFVDARAVVPQAANNTSAVGSAAPQLTKVVYSNLWPGISMAYDAGDGIAHTTYAVSAGSSPIAIRLRFNAPVTVETDGSLRIAYDNGEISENAPVAWQEVDGGRVRVPIAFRLTKVQEKVSEVTFRAEYHDPRYPLTISSTLTWNTFLGGTAADFGNGIAVDGSGNVYVAGYSNATWGSPVRAYTAGDYDAFVAKLGSDGSLIWHTFLGGSSYDDSFGITVDDIGNVYVVGKSSATWGCSPTACTVRAYTSGNDAFAAKLDSDGSLIWNTFLGGSGTDDYEGIAVDSSGNVYVAGWSTSTWGCSPTACTVRAYTAGRDAFAAKLGSDGSLTWNTFLGGNDTDSGKGIAVDTNKNVYVAGWSTGAWGCLPTTCTVRAYTPDNLDAFAAKLGSDGSLTWNTFLGGSDLDNGEGIVVDGSGNVYLAGASHATWGNPVRAYTIGTADAFAAKLGSDGSLTWHTFLGGSGVDQSQGIALDRNKNVYVAGASDGTWGNPTRAYTAEYDAFATRLDSDGGLTWNAFLGGSGSDYGRGIAVDGSGKVYVAGDSAATWSCSPSDCIVRAYTASSSDAFAAKLGQSGEPINIYLPVIANH